MSRALEQALAIARRITRQASDRVAELYDAYQKGADAGTVLKGDDGPVTSADRAANEIILSGLAEAFPEDSILSEENPESWKTSGEWTWMVDPLDGTKEFIKANGEFMVMVGLVHAGTPVLGVVIEPATGDELYALKGSGAWRIAPGTDTPVPLRLQEPESNAELILAVSRSHRSPRVEEFCKITGISKEFISGSVGRKIAAVSTGKAHLYLHPSPGTKLWDSCAPQVILEEAGGRFTSALAVDIPYQRPDGDVRNDDGILAAGSRFFDALAEASRKAWEVPLPPRPSKKK